LSFNRRFWRALALDRMTMMLKLGGPEISIALISRPLTEARAASTASIAGWATTPQG
jgi:hypothetical protein